MTDHLTLHLDTN